MQKLTFKTVSHEAFGDDERENLSMKCIRYFRFEKSVTVREIVLHPVNIRHVPVVTGQPKHILVETFDRKTETWKTVCDLTLPLFDEKHPHRIGTNGFRTELIRLICDEEHRVPPSRGEWYASPDVVPIRIFENTEIFGEECSPLFLPPYNPPLTKGKTAPSAIANTEISVKEHLVSYKSRYMHLVFSLKRPILLKMAFDPEGNGKTDVNILYDKTVWQAEFIGRPNCVIGPRFVSATQNLNSMSFTGEVELDGNAVLYKNLHCNDLFSMDLRFSVSETGFTVSVNKTCHTDFTAIESDDFDFVLDCDKTISGIQGVPCRNHSRVGTVSLPAVLCCPGIAGLDLTSSEQSPCVIQVDTIRSSRMSWFSPIVGGERDRYGFIRFHAGTYHASFSVSLGGIRPAFLEKIADPALYRTFWKGLTAALAFRSDFVGFSNNFLSGNCHNSEYHIAEMAPYFTGAKNGLSVRDLLRFTVECSLKNGPGYGDNRELYLDADPSILIAAARLYQLTRDDAWLTKYWKHIRTIADRILNNIENAGLIRCSALTGNSGSKEWSSNGWDVISFGNYDAYVNALGYRALRNAAAMAKRLGDGAAEAAYRSAADGIGRNFSRILLNPTSGVISGWVSADGKHHDYFFTHINCMSICFGLVDRTAAETILRKLLARLEELGLDYFHYGIPVNLYSIRKEDAPAGDDSLREDGLDTLGIYLNCSLSPIFDFYFVRALDLCGMGDVADKVCSHLAQTFAENTFYGGFGSGTEFFTWQGQPCGYEGPLVGNFPVLAAMAMHYGYLSPIEGEWCIDE